MTDKNIQELNEELKRLIDEDLLYEMSNFRKYITGLPVNVSLQIQTDDEKKYPHNLPRLKFQNNSSDRVTSKSDLIPVSIDPKEPKVLIDKQYNEKYFKEVKDWIIKNYDLLIQFWNQEIDEFELKDRLEKQNENK